MQLSQTTRSPGTSRTIALAGAEHGHHDMNAAVLDGAPTAGHFVPPQLCLL